MFAMALTKAGFYLSILQLATLFSQASGKTCTPTAITTTAPEICHYLRYAGISGRVFSQVSPGKLGKVEEELDSGAPFRVANATFRMVANKAPTKTLAENNSQCIIFIP